MKRRHALLALILLGPLAACEKKEDPTSPDAVGNQPPPQQPDPEEEKRLRRPPRASSGIGSDPDNPSGAPGGGGLSNSPTRY